jgi:hypothetical protein
MFPMNNDIDVISGLCAVKVGRYWQGCASGNRWAKERRRTVEAALKDAEKMCAMNKWNYYGERG